MEGQAKAKCFQCKGTGIQDSGLTPAHSCYVCSDGTQPSKYDLTRREQIVFHIYCALLSKSSDPWNAFSSHLDQANCLADKFMQDVEDRRP